VKKYNLYGLTLAFTWTFVTGSPTIPTLIQGMVFGLPVAYVFRRFYPGSIPISRLKKTPAALSYCLIFTAELITANLEAAYTIVSPWKKSNPDIIEYQPEIDSPTGIAILADSITLTPGTLVVDHIEAKNKLLIHCLNGGNPNETREDIRSMEKKLEKIFR
jgi:multicomponent Na+:H+ antiporter subunit E